MNGPKFSQHGRGAAVDMWVPGQIPAETRAVLERAQQERPLREEITSLKNQLILKEHYLNMAFKSRDTALLKLREAEEMIDMARAYQHQLNIQLLEEHKEWTARNILKRNTP